MSIIVNDSIKVSKTNTPTRDGERISSLAQMGSIATPYVGMRVYVENTGKEYVVTGLAKARINGVTVENAVVDTYVEVAYQSGVDELQSTLEGVEANLAGAIEAESTRAQAAESGLSNKIQQEKSEILNSLEAVEESLANNIATEEQRATEAEQMLRESQQAHSAANIDAFAAVQSRHDEFVLETNRKNSELATAITTEVAKEQQRAESVEEELREKMVEGDELISGTLSELKNIIEGGEINLADNIVWTKGAWSFTDNAGPGSSFMQETYRYVRIDISNYDYVTLSGLKNGGPMSNTSNRWPTISIYGDSKPIEYKQVEDGDTYVLYTHDYNIFKKIEIVILAYQSEDVYTPSVKVNKNSAFEGQFIPKRIVICGDSLTGNESSLVTLQLNSIAKSQGYTIIRNSMGGENIIGNLTRNGGIGIRVKSDFIMPREGIVDIELESAWMMSSGEYAHNPYNNLSNRAVVIMGVEGTLTRNSETSYTFSRNAAGEEFKVGTGTIFWDNALWTCRDYPHIWFTGQNGGYDNDTEWADMINMAARNFGENFIVCSTALSRTTAELVRCATIKFGNKYLNLKAYTEGQAVYDGQRFGLIDSSKLASDYAELFWPGEDKVHQNNLLSYMWAVLMWNTLVDLGYVKGKQVNGGEYYIP